VDEEVDRADVREFVAGDCQVAGFGEEASELVDGEGRGEQADAPTGRGSPSATARTALAVVCLVAASVIVLVGLWAIIEQ
jgi:hypothetical protein